MADSFSGSWNNFWNSDDATQNWANGTITKSGDYATYTGDDGSTLTFSSSSNPYQVAQQNSNIANQWESKWGSDWSSDYEPSTTTYLNGLTLFGQDISNLGPRSSSSSSSRSSSYSGLGKYGTDILDSVVPVLTSSIEDMDANIDAYSKTALDRANSLTQSSIKEMLPQYLDQLSARGIINSDTGSDLLSDYASQLTRDQIDRVYDAGMTGTQMKYNMPSILGDIANVARYSKSSGGSSSNSLSTNSLAPFELIANTILNMQ